MSMLGFADLLRRKESSTDSNTERDRDAAFENEIEGALQLEASEPFLGEDDDLSDATLENTETVQESQADIPAQQDVLPQDVLSAHGQSVMAAFTVFEEANNATREELTKIGKAFTTIVSNYNIGRQFLDGCRQEITRASELEQSNQRLIVENRRLLERSDKQEHARERMDDQLESAKRREARLIQECDALRMNVSDLRLELIETRNANVVSEHARTDMHMALAGKTADAERLARESEVLRDKLNAVTGDLDASHKRHSELRLKLEELHVQHGAEVNKYAELNGRVSAADKDILKLQKQNDIAEAQLKEANLALQTAEHDIWERDRRHQSELQALRSEMEQLKLQKRGVERLEPEARFNLPPAPEMRPAAEVRSTLEMRPDPEVRANPEVRPPSEPVPLIPLGTTAPRIVPTRPLSFVASAAE